MIALLVVGGIAVVEAVIIVVGKKKLEADTEAERTKVITFLDGIPSKAEVAIRREAEILAVSIKKKI